MQIIIREMQPGEEREVKKLFTRSLGIIDRFVFQTAFDEARKSAGKQCGGTLVAESDGKIVGTVSMRIKVLKGKRTGFIDALVSDKELRGRSIGRSLVDGSILWLEEHGCEVIYATADRYNSPSWNMFIHRGFHLYELPAQLRDYGLYFLRLWAVEFHFVGFGTFFLRRDKEKTKNFETREAWHLLAALLGVSTAWWIQILRGQGSLMLIPMVFMAVAISLLAHELSQRLVASRLGLETTFKAWGSGILFSWLLALLGITFIAYGSTYVKQLDWWYDPKKDKTGIIFAVGPVTSLLLGFAFKGISIIMVNNLLAVVATVGYATNLIIVILNLIPVQSAGGFVWDGKKIFRWSKTVWIMLVIATLILIILDLLL
ncbi:MAG: GNAT family N-acetyltransferase [Thermoproteota archaeon]|nr:GNAT family N-acetyltransferase [Candidatus Brockarchaeota archaeon]